MRYLRARAQELGIDADHIGVWGESAGGHLAVSSGVEKFEGDGGWQEYSSDVQAVCAWYGLSNHIKLMQLSGQKHNPPSAQTTTSMAPARR